MDRGPRKDICNFEDGSSRGEFNPITGDYYFESSDKVNYPPGEYSFQVYKMKIGTSPDLVG